LHAVQAQEQVRRGPTSVSEFEVSLADIYKGASIDVRLFLLFLYPLPPSIYICIKEPILTFVQINQFMIKKRVLCDHCRGSGAATDGDIHSCPECGGSGVRIVKQQIFPGMFAQSQVTCNKCGGRGRIIVRECPACAGQKVLDHTAQFTLDVPRGAPEGHEVVFEGEGDESPDWEAGDVVLRVRSRAEKGGLRRKESSLYWKETIGVDEVRLSYSKQYI
jgi:DnaJ-related protein SCJ1